MITRYEIHERIDSFLKDTSQNLRWAYRRHSNRVSIKKKISKPYMLTKEQKREARQYWQQYTKHFSPLWHEFIYQTTGYFDKRIVPEDVMFTEIEGFLNDWAAAKGIDNKCNYDLYFDNVKMPRTICRRMRGGIWHDNNWNIITEEQAIALCMNESELFVKIATEVGYGGGVKHWINDGSNDTLRKLFCLKGDLIVQERITQHPVLESIESKSVHCIRVVTLAINDRIEYLCGYFRMGQGNSKVDYQGGVVSSINRDGSLYPYGYSNQGFKKSVKHECGIAFKDITIPAYTKIVDKAISLHERMGDFRIISWDFSLSPNEEPILIESNIMYGGILYHQLFEKPFFGSFTDEILNEVYGK